MDGSVLEDKSSFKMLGLTFSSKESVILSLLVKLPPRKLEPWFILWSLFLLRLLCIYKSTIWPCIEYCWHFWAAAHSCVLELLDKLQKWICRTVGRSLAASLEPLAQCRNVATKVFSIGITLVDVYLIWLNWFHFLILKGGLLVTLIDFMGFFLSPFLDVTRISISTVSFLAQLISGILCP